MSISCPKRTLNSSLLLKIFLKVTKEEACLDIFNGKEKNKSFSVLIFIFSLTWRSLKIYISRASKCSQLKYVSIHLVNWYFLIYFLKVTQVLKRLNMFIYEVSFYKHTLQILIRFKSFPEKSAQKKKTLSRKIITQMEHLTFGGILPCSSTNEMIPLFPTPFLVLKTPPIP